MYLAGTLNTPVNKNTPKIVGPKYTVSYVNRTTMFWFAIYQVCFTVIKNGKCKTTASKHILNKAVIQTKVFIAGEKVGW